MQDADDQKKADANADSNKAADKDSTFDRVDATLDRVDEALGSAAEPSGVSDRVQNLTWALVDDQLDEPEVRQLEQLLLDDPQARQVYLDCIQLHTGLIYYFAEQRAKDDPNSSGSPFPLPKEILEQIQKANP